jgi:hypothetical protein
LKSVIEMAYIGCGADVEASPGELARWAVSRALQEDLAMTIEILYLTTQIQRWLNARVARHLAAQAARLAR